MFELVARMMKPIGELQSVEPAKDFKEACLSSRGRGHQPWRVHRTRFASGRDRAVQGRHLQLLVSPLRERLPTIVASPTGSTAAGCNLYGRVVKLRRASPGRPGGRPYGSHCEEVEITTLHAWRET